MWFALLKLRGIANIVRLSQVMDCLLSVSTKIELDLAEFICIVQSSPYQCRYDDSRQTNPTRCLPSSQIPSKVRVGSYDQFGPARTWVYPLGARMPIIPARSPR